MTRYRPEDQFLLDCLRFHFQSYADLKTDSNLNWDYILHNAARHRVVPLLYLALKAVQTPDALKEEFNRNALHSLGLAAELRRILTFLEVPSIPFKGPTLAALAYGNVSYRQFDDLDLLVYKHDFSGAKEALLRNGYSIVNKLNRDQEAAFLKSHHHCQFYNSNSGALLEVHWQIAPQIYSFRLEVPDLFDRAEKVKVFGQEILTLSPEDTLLAISEHGTRHYWSRLAWICDIAKLCESELDWAMTMERARSLGIERAILLAISLARDILESNVPDLLSSSTDKVIPHLVKEVEDRLFLGFSPTDPNVERFYIRARERSMDKLRYYAYRATIPTEDDLACIDLPGSLFPFYCLIRPIRLINRYGSKVVKWLR